MTRIKIMANCGPYTTKAAVRPITRPPKFVTGDYISDPNTSATFGTTANSCTRD